MRQMWTVPVWLRHPGTQHRHLYWLLDSELVIDDPWLQPVVDAELNRTSTLSFGIFESAAFVDDLYPYVRNPFIYVTA